MAVECGLMLLIPITSVTEDNPRRLRVGRLTKAHGLKGALKIELYTDAPERRFAPGASFSLQVPPESPWHGKTLTIRELRWFNGHPVGFFDKIDDRTAAESIVKAILWIEDTENAEGDEPEADAWYAHQLVGLAVIRDGVKIGEVTRLEHLPAQDLLIVRSRGRDTMVPFVSAIVPEVDIAGGTITVTPPVGLFEDVADEGSTDTPAAVDIPADDPAGSTN